MKEDCIENAPSQKKKKLASRKENSAPSLKSSKKSVTIICCGSVSSDHKMKLFTIGKSIKPRLFKGTEQKKLLLVDFNPKKPFE
ncbi:hypothetical protein TNIN_166761 [Trichonephila inaurata madagascariensis]|uniref:Uncharacterized protein n=1 Tax=Trichonephila inaurata madagascariensis TaxID=2747483 RepID=A0A8X7C068_9ARAC|nr:hypothetical protein TNIN_166761 [Trichonephila inaurata madagascariensis]